VPVLCCQSIGAGGYIDSALSLLHSSNHKTPKVSYLYISMYTQLCIYVDIYVHI
jgi:hypothetical protein